MKAIVRDCRVFIPSPAPGVGVHAASYYRKPDGRSLISNHSHISRSDTADIAFYRYSDDNGKSWSEPREWPTKFEAPNGTGRRHARGGYLDPITNRFITVWTQGVLPNDKPLEGMKNWVLYYSVSEDGGQTDIVNGQIIEEGPEFNAMHSLSGVTTGKNGVMMGDLTCRPITLADGTILIPAQSPPVGPDGEYFNPCGGLTYTDALVLLGRWKADKSIGWKTSERVKGDPTRSTRGMVEPTIAELPDGRILMVMRGSNDKNPEWPGYKWFSTSVDGGQSWTNPLPWTFTDGATFHSPSSCSQLVTHSSGHLFWVGNICPQNPKGNSPRYPIVLAEVDQNTGMLIESSITILDDLKPGDNPILTLSNFFVREDLETGDLLLHMTRMFANQPLDLKGRDWTSDALLYRIEMA